MAKRVDSRRRRWRYNNVTIVLRSHRGRRRHNNIYNSNYYTLRVYYYYR